MAVAEHESRAPEWAAQRPGSGVTARAVLLSLAFIFLINLAVAKLELITGRYIASGIPPIPASLILVLVALSAPLLGRISRHLVLSRREMLVIFCLLLASVPFCATYGIRAFLPRLTVLQYYALPENNFAQYTQHIPSWFAPTDQAAIIDMYEGLEQGGVPWHHWVKPLGWWTLFFTALYLTTMCLTTLVRRQWSEYERLPYPLVELPMELAGTADGQGVAGFFKNPLVYGGLSLALIYNALNIGHAINPAIPAIAQMISVDQFFTERPWTAFRPMLIATHPMYIGFGWLASQEVAFSIFFFTFAVKGINFFGMLAGYQAPGFPYFKEQSAGGYVAVALLSLWVARGHLKRAWLKASGVLNELDDRPEAVPYLLAFVGLAAGSVFFLGWCMAAGMSLKLAVPFWLLILCFGLTYARVRAECGVPHEFVYPWQMIQYSMVYALGGKGLLRVDQPRGIVVWTAMSFLSRFHHTQMMTAYQTDSYEIAQRGGIWRRSLAPMMVLAFIFGLVCAFWGHFTTFYDIGLNILEGNGQNVDWRTADTVQGYTQMVGWLEHPGEADINRTAWMVGAGLATVGMWVVRTTWLRFPLHPLGYIVATAYGSSTHLWFPFLLVWGLKSLVLRLSGVRGYRRLIPAFIAFTLGHFLFGGICWSLISLFYESSISLRYYTVF